MAKEKKETVESTLEEYHFPVEGVTILASSAADAIKKLNELSK